MWVRASRSSGDAADGEGSHVVSVISSASSAASRTWETRPRSYAVAIGCARSSFGPREWTSLT